MRGFSGTMNKIIQMNKAFIKNPNWREADQLAIYKRGWGVELGSTKNNSS